jgi:hypothetical protein
MAMKKSDKKTERRIRFDYFKIGDAPNVILGYDDHTYAVAENPGKAKFLLKAGNSHHELIDAMSELVSAAMQYRSSVQSNFGKPTNEAINSLSMALHHCSNVENKIKEM